MKLGLFGSDVGARATGGRAAARLAVSCIAALSLRPVLVLRIRPTFIFGRADGESAAAPARATSA
ncbi:hypothetical protein KF840_04910 [bacterium]|nr:hypothetical protein [bacterium]